MSSCQLGARENDSMLTEQAKKERRATIREEMLRKIKGELLGLVLSPTDILAPIDVMFRIDRREIFIDVLEEIIELVKQTKVTENTD